MRVSKLSVLFISFTLSGLFLLAADTGPIPFESYDKDGNGFISQKEYNERKTERMTQRAQENRQMKNAVNSPDFSYFDINGDGKISKNELTIRQQERMQKRINQKNQFIRNGGKGPRKFK